MKEMLIDHSIEFVKSQLNNAEGGHDWFHTERVWKLSKTIYTKENKGDLLVIELAAILHDIADSKFHNGPEDKGGILAYEFLMSEGLDKERAIHIREIINHISFKNSKKVNTPPLSSIEFQIVQDADRLDAIGAIGIARTFNYGGYKNRSIYNPEVPVQEYDSLEAYKKSTAPTINHFYEKLFFLKGLMNTDTGMAMAEDRHKYMEEFVKRFMDEWEGK